MNRKLSKWKARTFQSMLEYKLKWLELDVKYVNPRSSSKISPLCSGSMASYEGRLTKCEKCGLTMDRDIVAVLNLQMWGIGSLQKPSMSSSRGKSYVCLSKTTWLRTLEKIIRIDKPIVKVRFFAKEVEGTFKGKK